MATIDYLDFHGMRPARTPKLVGQNYAVICLNCFIEDGACGPNYSPSVDATLSKAGTIDALYKLTDTIWLHWTEEIKVARMPIEDNNNDRVAYTGPGLAKPMITDATKAASGGTDYPEVSYWLGLPAPADALTGVRVLNTPTCSLHGQWDIAGTFNNAATGRIGNVYTYTYVTAWGEEGPPADPSEIIYTNSDEDVELSNFSGAPTGTYQTAGMSVRIYRLISGTAEDNEYLFVDEVALPVSEPYTDDTGDDDLGESLKTATWSAPNANMQGITAMANGMLAGFVGNDLYFSVPYQGHAWPEDYRRSVDYDIVGLAADGNMLFVLTEGYPYIVTGNHPTVLSMEKKSRAPACVSAASIVDMGGGAIYASNEGLAMINYSGVQVISRGVMNQRFWEQLNPSTLHGAFYKDRYVGFYAADGEIDAPDSTTAEPLPQYGHFQFDLEKQELLFSSEWGPSAFSDMETAGLFYCKDDAGTNKVYQWEGNSASSLSYSWRSGTKVTVLTSFTSARVDARTYPVTFNLYAHGVLEHTKSVADREPFRLPAGNLYRDWAVEIEGTAIVDGVFLSTDIDELL